MASAVIRYEEAAERRTVDGWVCKTCRRWWGSDEHMARWCCSTDQPCACGGRRTKTYTICDACREKKELEQWEKRERRPYDGGLLYSDAYSRYFDDADDAADWAASEGLTYEDMRLLLCDKEYPHEIDPEDCYADSLPEDCTLDDVAPDLAEAIGRVNEVVAQMRKDGKQLSWMPSKYAVDIATLPPLESAPAADAVDPPVGDTTA